jgi:hypothetical protein
MPELLRERPLPVQAIAALVVPAIFGGITGWTLGVNEAAYVVLSLLGIGGGYFAGFEHEGTKAGAIRGIFGGSLFGASILLVHEAIGAEPKAHLPHPEILLVGITTAFGVGLGALGGRRRAQLEAAGETDRPYLDVHLLGLSEAVAAIGATALVWSLWLPWFATSCESTSPATPAGCNPHSLFDAKPGVERAVGQFDAVEAFATLPLLLMIAALIPLVAAWMIARSSSGFSPGETVMIAGIYATMLVLLNGLILGRPGEQSVDVSLQWGYFVAIAGALAIMAGGMMRRLRELRGARSPRPSESRAQRGEKKARRGEGKAQPA